MNPRVLIIAFRPQSNGTYRIVTTTGPSGAMGVTVYQDLGVAFPNRDAAYNVALSIADNVEGPSRIGD